MNKSLFFQAAGMYKEHNAGNHTSVHQHIITLSKT